ncbi:MAG TPA: preprotein translocase subunit SecE [Saprospiraceae bacterium]|nr:preprotein translocase subunit SecE [Saprospiraceae bacterium]
MNQVIGYLKESYNELLHKVTWPTMPNLLSSARLVVVASLMIAILVFLMDLVSKQVVTFIYNLNG